MRALLFLTIYLLLSNVIQPKKYLVEMNQDQNDDRRGVEDDDDDDDENDSITTAKSVESKHYYVDNMY